MAKPSPARRKLTAPVRSRDCRSLTTDAHDDGPLPAVTKTAARRQSSSKASGDSARATKRPSARRVTHPAASHFVPSGRLGSPGARASPSAASHSRTAKLSLPVLITAKRPSLARAATTRPSEATNMSGDGVASAHTLATTTAIPPLQRKGVRRRQTSNRPAVPRTKGPIPKALMRPTAPGSPATHKATASIHPMPSPLVKLISDDFSAPLGLYPQAKTHVCSRSLN